MALDVAAFKQAQREVWSAGDYPDIASGSSRQQSAWWRPRA